MFLLGQQKTKTKEDKKINLQQLLLTQLEDQTYNMKFRDISELGLFKNFTPDEFKNIRKQWLLYDNRTVQLSEFVSIILESLYNVQEYKSDVGEIICKLIEIFQLIDKHSLGSINFNQFSNFLIDFGSETRQTKSLLSDHIQLVQSTIVDETIHSSKIEKLYSLEEIDLIGILEHSLKTLRFFNVNNLQSKGSINTGKNSINSVVYFHKFKSIIIATQDKFITLYDSETYLAQTKIQMTESQNHMAISSSRKLLYSTSGSGTFYITDIEAMFSIDFKDAVKQKKENWKMLARLKSPFNDAYEISCLLNIEELNTLAVGSTDSNIRLYPIQNRINYSNKTLKGHSKGIRDLSYSAKQKLLISCAFDFNVLIWNPCCENPIMKLIGKNQNSIYFIYQYYYFDIYHLLL